MFQMLSSCKSGNTPEEEQLPVVSVKVNPIIKGDIENEISFNGRTVYLKKTQVATPIAGYVVRVNVKFGQEVQKDEVLFEIQTRERKALESDPDSSGEIGLVKVLSVTNGFIDELNIHEKGGFVPEGGILCNIADSKDLVVQVNVPFEYNSIPVKNKRCKIDLSDNTDLNGTVLRVLPVIDEVNQTQTILIKPETNRQIPENLNTTVRFIKEKHIGSLLVTKSSLMTNETQDEFWVMKITDNNIAVKIAVTKGIENDSIVEIVSSRLKANDMIIFEGSYGLPDSTLIRIEE
jgi:hypothetical protein